MQKDKAMKILRGFHSRLLFLSLVALLALGSATTLFAAPAAQTDPTRITFASGATSAQVTGNVGGYTVIRYVIGAGAGQSMQVSVTSPTNNVYLSVVAPSGAILASAPAGAKSFNGTLTEAGDYIFRVSTTPGAAWTTYQLDVSITGTPLPTPLPTDTTQRIQFAPGAISAVVSGRIDGFQIRNYLLRALAGQTMIVSVASPAGDAYLTVVSPGGSPLARAQAGAQSFNGALPETGDYRLSVLSPSGTAHTNFVLSVTVTGSTSGGGSTTQRITFAAGATGTTISGRIDGAQIRNYLLNARAGQTMTVTVTSPAGGAFLTVVSPGGSPLARAQAGAQAFSGVLPESGDYRLSVLHPSGTANTNFVLTVSVTGATSGGTTAPQRINFAAGATSAIVNGQADGGTAKAYVLNARAGQRMQINLATTGNPVYLTVVSPSGNALVNATLGETSLDRFLPENGDYRITVSVLPGVPLTNFTMSVSVT